MKEFSSNPHRHLIQFSIWNPFQVLHWQKAIFLKSVIFSWLRAEGNVTFCAETLLWVPVRHLPAKPDIKRRGPQVCAQVTHNKWGKGGDYGRLQDKVVLLHKRKSMGWKAMGKEEWTKIIQPCNIRFRSSLGFQSVSRIVHFACVSYPKIVWDWNRGSLLPSQDLNLIPHILAMGSNHRASSKKVATSNMRKSNCFPAGKERAHL